MLAEMWACPRCNAEVGQHCRKSFMAFGVAVVLAEIKARYPCKARQRLAAGEAIKKRKEGK